MVTTAPLFPMRHVLGITPLLLLPSLPLLCGSGDQQPHHAIPLPITREGQGELLFLGGNPLSILDLSISINRTISTIMILKALNEPESGSKSTFDCAYCTCRMLTVIVFAFALSHANDISSVEGEDSPRCLLMSVFFLSIVQ